MRRICLGLTALLAVVGVVAGTAVAAKKPPHPTTAAKPVNVTAISLTQGTTTTNLSGFTSALPTNATSPAHLATCTALSRPTVLSILKGTTSTTLTITTSAGNLTATLS